MKTKLLTLALAVLTVGLLGSCEKDDDGPEMSKFPKGALSGEFTVNAEGKKVHFSQGNLWADGSKTLHFEFKQYSSPNSWDASHVSHFTWSNSVADAVGNSNSGSNLFCDESHKVSVDGSEAIYYALSKDEWNYLFNTRTVRGGTGKDNSYSHRITYGNITGLVLYPDNYAGPTLSGTVESLPEGVVFLPAAGWRKSSNVSDVGNIDYFYYWSSSERDVDYAYRMVVDMGYVYPAGGLRYLGFSVRLVTDVK